MSDALTTRLATHLKDLRLARGLSLDALAAASGISRATLSRLENGETSPTASMLGALASAHGTAISRLLAQVEDAPRAHIRAADQAVWTDPETGFQRRTVSPPGNGLIGEVLRGHLPAGQSIAYKAPTVPGQQHHLILHEGALILTLQDISHHLAPGDCLRYRLHGPSRFQTSPENAADYTLVLI